MADFDIREISLEVPEQDEKTDPPHKTLRHASLRDMPHLIKLAEEIYKDSPMSSMPISTEKVRSQLERFIISDQYDFLCLVSHDEGKVVGVLAAYAFSPIFTEDRIAVEVLWYLHPDYRKGRRGVDMMKAYEYWAKLVGCTVAQYGWLESSPVSMKRLYELSGAEPVEQVYYKVLK